MLQIGYITLKENPRYHVYSCFAQKQRQVDLFARVAMLVYPNFNKTSYDALKTYHTV